MCKLKNKTHHKLNCKDNKPTEVHFLKKLTGETGVLPQCNLMQEVIKVVNTNNSGTDWEYDHLSELLEDGWLLKGLLEEL